MNAVGMVAHCQTHQDTTRWKTHCPQHQDTGLSYLMGQWFCVTGGHAVVPVTSAVPCVICQENGVTT